MTDDLKLRTSVSVVLKMISLHTKNSNITYVRLQMFKVFAASQIMGIVSLLFRDKQILKWMRVRLLYIME